jgi:hypothetical protein
MSNLYPVYSHTPKYVTIFKIQFLLLHRKHTASPWQKTNQLMTLFTDIMAAYGQTHTGSRFLMLQQVVRSVTTAGNSGTCEVKFLASLRGPSHQTICHYIEHSRLVSRRSALWGPAIWTPGNIPRPPLRGSWRSWEPIHPPTKSVCPSRMR